MLPRGWAREVYDRLERLPAGPDQLAARILLRRLTEQAVRCGASFDISAAWLENALRARADRRIEGIVATQADAHEVPDIWKFVESATSPITEMIPHTIAGFERACRRLVESAPRSVIVDPYFDIARPRCFDVLRGLIQWGSEGRCTEYDVYCRATAVLGTDAGRLERFDRQASDALAKAGGPRPFRVRTFLLDDKRGDQSPMHRRALVTEHGGIGIDYGFRIEEGRTSDVTVMAGAPLDQLIEFYYDGRHPYGEPVHFFEYSGGRSASRPAGR